MIALTIFATAVYSFILWRSNRGSFLLSPSAVHLAYLLLYVVVPAVTLRALDLPHSFGGGVLYYMSDTTFLSILLGIVGLAVGTLIAGKGADRQSPLTADLRGRNFRALSVLALVLSVSFVVKNLSYMEFMTSLQALGEPDRYAMVQRLKAEALDGSTYLLQGANQISPMIALLFLAKYYCGEGKKYLHWSIGFIVFAFVFTLLCGNLWVAFAPLVMVVMVRQYFRPANRKQLMAAATLLPLLVVGLLVIKFGSSSLENDKQDTMQLFSLAGQRFASGAGTVELMVETYPRERDYEYGLTYVRDVVSMIPSPVKREFFPESWWGGFNGYISYELGFYKSTAQVPVMGEFYANFGLVGVLAGSLVYGFALQRLSNALRLRSIKKASWLVCFVVLGYRFAEATVEGVGGRFPVACLWLAIFFLYYAATDPRQEAVPTTGMLGEVAG